MLPLEKIYILIGDSLLRTGIIVGLGVVVVYKWRISESVNGLMRKMDKKIKGRKGHPTNFPKNLV
jgi:hypothetical protein